MMAWAIACPDAITDLGVVYSFNLICAVTGVTVSVLSTVKPELFVKNYAFAVSEPSE